MNLKRTPMRRTRMRQSRQAGGSGIPAEVRDAVLLRDEGKCVRCGMWLANVPSSIHHRLPRRMGGRSGLALIASYDMGNLLTLCGSGATGCHGEIESDRAQARDDGYLLREGEDPSSVPVLSEWGWRYYGETWSDA